MTPEEIQLKTFAVTLRGFDQSEVAAFLSRVAEEHRLVLAELEDARLPSPKAPPSELAPESTTDPYAAPLNRLSAQIELVLQAAHSAADERKAQVEREAEQVRAEAERLRGDAEATRAEAARLLDQVAADRRAAEQLYAGAKALYAEATTLRDQATAAVASADRDRVEAMQTLRDVQETAEEELVEVIAECEARRERALREAAEIVQEAELAARERELAIVETAGLVVNAAGAILDGGAELALRSASLRDELAASLGPPLQQAIDLANAVSARGDAAAGAPAALPSAPAGERGIGVHDVDGAGCLGPAPSAEHDANDGPPTGGDPEIGVQGVEVGETEGAYEPDFAVTQPVAIGVNGGEAEGEHVQEDEGDAVTGEEGNPELVWSENEPEHDSEIEASDRDREQQEERGTEQMLDEVDGSGHREVGPENAG